ncbi:MAG: lysophospholipase [Gemmatimonadota bacterium]
MNDGRSYIASDGTRLRLHEWSPESESRAGLLLIHGVGEHGARYDTFARGLAGRGIHVFGFDHRGHGRSDGPRVHVDRWDRYLADARELTGHVSSRVPDVPLFVYGHSMGALICLGLAIAAGQQAVASPPTTETPKVRGWIVSGTGIQPTGIAKPHLVAIARLLSGVLPRLSLDLGVAAETLSHDPEVVSAYSADPLVQKRASVRWGTEALDAIDFIKQHAGAIADPLLVIHGEDDPLARADGSRWLADVVAGATLIIYAGALHEPHNDPTVATVSADVADWIEAHGERADT